jgi:hypothetical protein
VCVCVCACMCVSVCVSLRFAPLLRRRVAPCAYVGVLLQIQDCFFDSFFFVRSHKTTHIIIKIE